jgi:hypothetical protein
MDYCESAKIGDAMLIQEAAYDVEHQVHTLPYTKVLKIYNYCFNTSLKLKKPCYPIVVTNEDYPAKKTYIIDGFEFTIYFRVFNREKIYKILNNISKKDYSKYDFSDEDYLNLVHCLIFAKKEFAKDVIERISHLLATIEKISLKHQLDLHLPLKMMIKYHFKGNDEKIRELLTMITTAIHESKTEEIPDLEQMKAENHELKTENSDLKSENTGLKTENTQLKAENQRKDTELSQRNAEIEKLKKIISVNGIII